MTEGWEDSPLDKAKCYLFFSGYYAASSASMILNRYNINNRIVRAPVSMRGSCGFALLVDPADEERCCMLLEKEKVIIEKKAYKAGP